MLPTSVWMQSNIIGMQGPPGTGKTSAIVALVSAFHAQRRAAPAAAAGALEELGGDPEAVPPSGVRVLVCAQSNAAVDELVVRLAHGFYDGSDGVQR